MMGVLGHAVPGVDESWWWEGCCDVPASQHLIMQGSCFQENILPPPGPHQNFPNLSIPPKLCLQTCSNHTRKTQHQTNDQLEPPPPGLKSHHPTQCISHKKHGFSSLSQLEDLPSTNSTINSCLRDLDLASTSPNQKHPGHNHCPILLGSHSANPSWK